MSDPLHRLLEVQDEDTHGDQIRHRRETHPLRAELAAARRQREDLDVRLGQEQERLDALTARQTEMEAEVAAGRGRMEGIEKRMYSGEVGAARDLQAMAEEVDGLRGRIRRLEDVILEVMEEREPVEALVGQLAAERAAVAGRLAHIESDLGAAEQELTAEEAGHAARRAELAGTLPPELTARYERLRQRLGGVGVARLVNGSCGGCHLTLSATELDRLRKAPADEVLTCEQCGRVLVRQ
ncbi:MAG TPA: C4-type zinc ribbon domain-containing protein [Acidimicrobiales bacterium]|nr:C4-type zinc ribbon domain-containing protein [Acidimicrobiales bacterium]